MNILRSQKKAKPEFRFSVNTMRTFVGKKLKIQYDDKEFTGRVDDFYYDGEHNSGLIMESDDGEWKHIKLYRLQKVEIVN